MKIYLAKTTQRLKSLLDRLTANQAAAPVTVSCNLNEFHSKPCPLDVHMAAPIPPDPLDVHKAAPIVPEPPTV